MRQPKNYSDLEKVVNDVLGLSGTSGSGSVHGDGDGKGRSKNHSTWVQVLNESKYTEREKKSVSFKKADFEKTRKAALRLGRIPIMTTYDQGDRTVYVHLELEDFKRIYASHLRVNEEVT